MFWLMKFSLLLNWVVLAVKYIRLDEGERLFGSQTIPNITNIMKSQKQIETILTFDLKSLVNSHQESPFQAIKLKQFKYNHQYEIGILLQLPNKSYQVHQILQINESLSNGEVNFQSKTTTYYIEQDENLKCVDFTFISNQSVQVLCVKDQVNLLTLNQEKEINKIYIDIPIQKQTKRQAQIFYYSEQQLSIILTESIEQGSALIFVQGNQIQKIVFLNQYIMQKQIYSESTLELIDAQLQNKYFILLLTQGIIIQFDLKTEKEYIFQSFLQLTKIILVGDDALIQDNDGQYKKIEIQGNQFLPDDYTIDTQQINTANIINSIIINRVAYNIEDQSSIKIGDQSFKFDYFEVIYDINGLIIIKDMKISLFYISQSFQYMELEKMKLNSQTQSQDISVQLNNQTVIFSDKVSFTYDYLSPIQQNTLDLQYYQNYWTFSLILSGPYGIIDINDDALQILQIPKFLFCLSKQYEFIMILLQNGQHSYWICQSNRIIYFIICHNQYVVQRSEIMEYTNIQDYYINLKLNSQNFIIHLVSNDNKTIFQVDIERISEERYSINVTKYEQKFTNMIYQITNVWNYFDANFKNDSVFIFREGKIFNFYQFQDCEIMDLITFSETSLLMIKKSQTNQISMTHFKLLQGKLLKLKELPTFGYFYRKVYDIQRQFNIITILIENQEQKQFLATYKIDLVKIDCQVALIEYSDNPDIRYVFSEKEYFQLDFKNGAFQQIKYYQEQYQIQFKNQQQFQTNTQVSFRIRNQLIDQIITLNLTLNDYSNSLIAYQDTVIIQKEMLMQIKVQNLFYGIISNISCENCEITQIFQITEKYLMQTDKSDRFIDQLIQISDKYIIILTFNSKFLIFNKQFQFLHELSVNENLQDYAIISNLNICDACFLFRFRNGTALHIQVKQLIDFDLKVIFEKQLLSINRYDKFQVTEDFIVQLSEQSYLILRTEIFCYKFVLDTNGQIYLQSQQFSSENLLIYNVKIKQIDQQILIQSKLNRNQHQVIIIQEETFNFYNISIIFKSSLLFDLHFHKIKQNGDDRIIYYYASSISQVYLGHIKLTQSQIVIDMDNQNNYSHLLIIKSHNLIQHINYISDKVVIVTSRQSQKLIYAETINIYQVEENQKYIHPVQSMSYLALYHFKHFINNTFICTSHNALGMAKLQEFYQVSTNQNNLILEANGVEGKAIVNLKIIENQFYKIIQILIILVFGIYLEVYINYQHGKQNKCQKFKEIEDQ